MEELCTNLHKMADWFCQFGLTLDEQKIWSEIDKGDYDNDKSDSVKKHFGYLMRLGEYEYDEMRDNIMLYLVLWDVVKKIRQKIGDDRRMEDELSHEAMKTFLKITQSLPNRLLPLSRDKRRTASKPYRPFDVVRKKHPDWDAEMDKLAATFSEL